jgi:hypothetical protein
MFAGVPVGLDSLSSARSLLREPPRHGIGNLDGLFRLVSVAKSAQQPNSIGCRQHGRIVIVRAKLVFPSLRRTRLCLIDNLHVTVECVHGQIKLPQRRMNGEQLP